MERVLKNIFIFFAGFICGAIIFSGLAYYAMFDSHTLDEFKVSYSNLKNKDISPQLREYLKERIYWNMAVWMRKRNDFFNGYYPDFGPVNKEILGNVSGIKDCSTSKEVYEQAMKRHGQKGRILKK